MKDEIEVWKKLTPKEKKEILLYLAWIGIPILLVMATLVEILHS